MIKKWVWAIGLLIFSGLALGKTVIYTETQDLPPYFVKNADGSIGGLYIELMQLIEAHSDYLFQYPPEMVPGARAIYNLEAGHAEFRLGAVKTAEREKTLVFTEPVVDASCLFFVRKNDPGPSPSLDDIRKISKTQPVLVILGAACNRFLTEQGIAIDAGGKTIETNLDKLANNRGRFFAFSDFATYYVLNQPKYRDRFKTLPLVLGSSTNYATFSKKLPPAVIEGMTSTIRKLKKTSEWKKIIAKYNSMPH